MAKLLKRLGSLALAILMVVSLLPINALQAFAAETAEYAAQIGTKQYATLAEAAAAAGNQNVITMLADSTGEELNIKNNCTLKLNGFELKDAIINVKSGKSMTISGAGGLTGTTTIAGSVNLTAAAEDLVINSGTTTVKTGATVGDVTVQGTGVLKDDYALVSGTITATARVNNSSKKLWGYYGDVDTAVAATTTSYTMILLQDVVRSAPIKFAKKVSFDLNGHNISVTGDCTTAIVNNYGLTLTDSTSDATVVQGRIIAPVAVENNSTLTLNGGVVIDGQINNQGTGTLTVKSAQLNGAISTTAVVKNGSGVVQNYYASLQAAIEATSKGYSVVILRDTELTEAITVPAAENLTLDLNGHTISQTKAQTEAYSMIENYGTLVITDSVGGGKISYTDSGNGGEYVSNTITNSGTLTVKGGTIENASATIVGTNGYPYAIDNNSTTANAKLTIQGGTLVSNAYCSVRQFCNSTTYTNTLSITGGTLNGGIELQNPNAAANLGSLKISGGNINGGTVAALYAFGANGSDWANMTASITGGNFTGNVTVTATADLEKFITGGVYSTDVSALCAEGLGATLDANGKYVVSVANGVAQIGDVQYMSLEEALNAVKADETIVLLENITIECDGIWDSRFTAVNYPITLDGNNKTVKIVGKVGDNNGNYVLRFNDNSTIRNLTLDLSDTTGMLSGIAAKKGITLENCHLIGTSAAKTRGIQYGASAGSNIADVEVVITDCTFTDWAYGVSDNQSGYDAKSVTITGSTFDNASVLISAWDTVTFTGNTLADDSYARIESYTGKKSGIPVMKVVAWDNIMQPRDGSYVGSWITNVVSYEQIQWEIYCYAPAAVIVESGYGYHYDTLARAFDAALEGQTVCVLQSYLLEEDVANTKKLTLDLNGKYVFGLNNEKLTNTSQLTIIGEGTLEAEIRLDAVDAIVVAEERFNVTSGVDGYVVVYENGVYRLVGLVASVTDTQGNVEYFTTLEAALKAVQEDGSIVTLLKDITITGPWDSRKTAVNYEITLDGNDKILTFVGDVKDLNGEYLLRLNKDSVIKDLTLDASQTTGMLSGVAAKQGITVADSTFIGNGEARTRAIQYGASAGSNIANVEVTVTDSIFTNWAFGVSDNQSGFDAKSVTVTGSTFNNASSMLSASESITFTENIIASGSYSRINSYTGDVTVLAWDNTMEHHASSKVTGANSYEQVQWEFITPAPAGVIVESGYGYYYDTLDRAFNAVQEGQSVRVLQDTELAASVANTKKITLELNGKVVVDNDYMITNTNQLTVVGEGQFDAEIQLIAVDATVVAAEGFNVTSGVDGYVVVYENGVYRLEGTVATVTDTQGNVEYFTTLQAAIDAAEAGELVTLLRDIELAETVVNTKEITLDLNGKVITGTDNNTTGNFYLINNNKGDLTIVDSSDEQTGAITLTATNERNWSASSVVVANNQGTVTLESGTIQHLGGTAMAYGIDNLTNGTAGQATTIVNGGNVDSTYFAIRQFANSTTDMNAVVINDGAVGYVWMQSPNDAANLATTGVEGGAVAGICLSGGNAEVTLKALETSTDVVYGTPPTGEVVVLEDGYYILAEAVATVTDAEGNVELFASLQSAVAAAQEGELVTLLKDVTITEQINLDKEITLDLGDNTVTATSKKAFEVHADVTIQNGTIEAANRCVDTRTAVELNLTDVTLIADEYTTHGNPQPLTIGGYDNGTVVNMNGVTIDAGTSGYGIITFVETELNAKDSTISGYSALYVKPGSEGSEFNFESTDLIGSTASNDVAGNSFSTIAIRANDVTVNADADSTVTANGNYCNAISVGGSEGAVEGAQVVVTGTITGNILSVKELADNIITVNDDYAEKINEEGFAYIDNQDGTITVAETVATVTDADGKVTPFATLQAAIDAAKAGELVTLLKDVTESDIITINKSITLDGGDHTITSSAGRAINIDSANGAVDVKIQDLNIVGENDCQRGINIIDSIHSVTTTPATVSLTNVDISGVSHYAVHVATSAGAADVTIEDSQLSGWAAVAVYGSGSTVTVEDSNLIGTNNYSGASNSFSTIALGGEDISISVTGGSITAVTNGDQTQKIIGAINGSCTDCQVYLDTQLNYNEASGIVGLQIAGTTVTLRDDYIAQVNAEGYAYIDNGDGTITLVEAVATVTDADGKVTPFASLQGAIDAAEPGELVTLLKDVNESEIITIDKPITLDGNGKTLNSSATRAINVETQGQVTIQDLTVTGTANTERAINVIKQPATLTLENVTAEDFKYTVNVAASSVGSNITINGGKFSGYAALNVTGDNTVVTVNDAELIGNNNAPVHESNAFAVISIGDETSGQTADNVKIMVNGGTITATSVNGNDQFIVNGTAVTNATVVIDAQLNLYDGLVFNGNPDDFRLAAFRNEYGDELNAQGYIHERYTDTLIKLGGYAVAYNVQTDVYYDDLQFAIVDAEEGQTVRPIVDITDSVITVYEGVTLDLNGYTLTTKYFTVYGDVIDCSVNNAGGDGLVKASRAHVAGLQSYLSLYDDEAGGYRFYAYEVRNLGAKPDLAADTVKFGLRIYFENAEGYRLLSQPENGGVTVYAYVCWTGLGNENIVRYPFRAATVSDAYANQYAAPSRNIGLTLTLRGISRLGANPWITMTPAFVTDTGMEALGPSYTWSS